MEYICEKCGMSVKGLECGKCGSEMRHNKIQNSQGKELQVSECPNECGKIKSPTCCGEDMHAVR